MKNPKVYRLAAGLIILFSIFLFQGSDDKHGVCTQCSDEFQYKGILQITNGIPGEYVDSGISVFIIPTKETLMVLRSGVTKKLWLNPGIYHIIAQDYHSPVIVAIRMIEIQSNVTSSITIE